MTLPTVVGPVEAWDVLAAALTLLLAYGAHEMYHIAALGLYNLEYTIEWPQSLRGILAGGVHIDIDEPAPRWQVVTVALAPLFVAAPAVIAWAVVLTLPAVDVGIILALVGWFVAAIPSPNDWVTALRYRQADAEAAYNGGEAA